jgi:hypothetical protein
MLVVNDDVPRGLCKLIVMVSPIMVARTAVVQQSSDAIASNVG